MSTPMEFAALVQASLDSAFGPGTSRVEASGPVDGLVEFKAEITLANEMSGRLPEGVLDDPEDVQREGAAVVAHQLAHQLAEPLGGLAFNLAASTPEQFTVDAAEPEEVEDDSHEEPGASGDELSVQPGDD